jgi:peptide/nickel transport system substrate-binding protein
MKKMTFLRILSLWLVLSIGLVSCATATPEQAAATVEQEANVLGEEAAEPAEAPAAEPQQPQEILELRGLVGDFVSENLDPILLFSGSNVTQTAEPFMERLLVMRNGELVGELAERWETDPDGLSYTFYLRDNVYFQDGVNADGSVEPSKKLTAEDVKFSIERYRSETSQYKALVDELISSVEVIDEKTVRIFTNGPQAYFLDYMRGDRNYLFFIMPKDYIEKNGEEYYNKHPIGTGPYKFVQLIPGDSMEYEAWDGYWGTPPDFKKYTMLLVPEEATAVAMLQTGEADIIYTSFDTAMNLKDEGYDIQGVDPSNVALQFFGTQTPQIIGLPTADPRVRLALRLAINQDEIINDFFKGESSVGVPRGVAPWMAGVDYEYWEEYSAGKYYYDPEEARRLLAEAGYPDGFSIKLVNSATSGSQSWITPLVEIIAKYWREIGVTPEIVTMDWAAFKEIRNVKDSLEGVGMAWIGENGLKSNVPDDIANNFSNQLAFNLLGTGADGTSNPPEIEEMIEQSRQVIDEQLYHDLILKVDETNVVFPICMGKVFVVVSPRVDVTFEYPISTPSEVAATARYKE